MSVDPVARAKVLMQRKADIEEEMEGYQGNLTSQGVTMSSPLVDPQGFPRADIDVYAVRHARTTLIRLRNDHRAVVEELGKVLEVVYARRKTNGKGGGEAGEIDVDKDEDGEPVGGESSEMGERRVRKAFARVNQVASGSPAEQAGLQPSDLILQFSTLTAESLTTLSDIAGVVNSSEGVEIPISILRPRGPGRLGEEVELRLVPRSGWGGRGMLGYV